MKVGGPPNWGPGAKSAVGTAAGDRSCVWFTIAKGCLTEIYYPRPDIAHVRYMFLVVTGEDGFFSDERDDTHQRVLLPEPGIPLFQNENRCRQHRYRITKSTFTDPFRDVLLQTVRFEPLSQESNLHLWLFLIPGIANQAYGNNAFAGLASDTLIATRANFALGLKATCGFLNRGCAFQDPTDPWHQLKHGIPLNQTLNRAEDGNVLLYGELDYRKTNGQLVLAIGFADSSEDAARKASESLDAGTEPLEAAYRSAWQEYQRKYGNLNDVSRADIYATSVSVLKTHQSKRPAGGMVASLGVPWGEIAQQVLDFRYQLSWTRDVVESASAFLAIGDIDSARQAWGFLVRTQEKDGHWAQNVWLDGTPHWNGIQMDETALPILLADFLSRYRLISAGEAWPTVRRAAAYLVANGPGTEEDRWENDGGYSPYTLSIEIAALLAAADIADAAGESNAGEYFKVVADFWNDNIESWTFIDGHYVRLATARKNRAGEIRRTVIDRSAHSHSPAALALVRFGLRRADDPRILKTVADIDRHLKSETAVGPVWHRYPDDHYGEHDDGVPYDGDGRGRGWPLLAGERAHYEIARGNVEEARKILSAIEKQASACGLIPEQVWDSADLPDHGLFSGRPSGSAMPLVWAHAEYIKLQRSLADGAIFDMPPQTVERYQKKNVKSRHALWRPNQKIPSLLSGKILRIQSQQPATVYWTFDEWKTVRSTRTADSGLGVQYCDLPTSDLRSGARVGITLRWHDGRWENRAYALLVETPMAA